MHRDDMTDSQRVAHDRALELRHKWLEIFEKLKINAYDSTGFTGAELIHVALDILKPDDVLFLDRNCSDARQYQKTPPTQEQMQTVFNQTNAILAPYLEKHGILPLKLIRDCIVCPGGEDIGQKLGQLSAQIDEEQAPERAAAISARKPDILEVLRTEGLSSDRGEFNHIDSVLDAIKHGAPKDAAEIAGAAAKSLFDLVEKTHGAAVADIARGHAKGGREK